MKDDHRDEHTLGLIAIAIAAALWAVAAVTARKLFEDGVPPIELVEARAVVTAVGLSLVPGAWRKPRRSLPRTHIVALGIAIAAVNATYYMAIDRLAVAVAIVLQYTAPALVVGWVAVKTRTPPQRKIVIAVVMATAGVVLASELPGGELGRLDIIGILLGLASAVLFATYTLLSEKAGNAYGSLGALVRAFTVASIGWVIFQLPRGIPHSLFEAGHLPGVIFVGIAGTLLPFLLFLWGVTKVEAERAAVTATLEPVLAAVVAWVWLGQQLSLMQLVGGSLAIAAVVSLQLGARRALVVPDP